MPIALSRLGYKFNGFFCMLFICKSNSCPSLAVENNDIMNLRPRGPWGPTGPRTKTNQSLPNIMETVAFSALRKLLFNGFLFLSERSSRFSDGQFWFSCTFWIILKCLKCPSVRLLSVVIARNSFCTVNSDQHQFTFSLYILPLNSINHKRLKIEETAQQRKTFWFLINFSSLLPDERLRNEYGECACWSHAIYKCSCNKQNWSYKWKRRRLYHS